MYGVLMTAVIAIGVQPIAEIPTNDGVSLIVDGSGSNCVNCNCFDCGHGRGSGLSCDCIRSSANYSWNWLGSIRRICHPPQTGQCGLPPLGKSNCPEYYSLYDRPYNYRRLFDYPWRSPKYRPRNVVRRGVNSASHGVDRTKPGYDELAPAPEVLLLPGPPGK